MSEETIPQMRERIEELSKQVKALTGTNDELSTTNRTLEAKEVFRQAGYDPNQAELYPADSGDINVENVTEFAQKYSLTPTGERSTEDVGDAGSSTDGDLNSMAGAGTGAGGGGSAGAGDKTISRDEWRDLARTDPVAAREAVNKGRVRIRSDNFYVKNISPTGA